jgi:hypothetical protein
MVWERLGSQMDLLRFIEDVLPGKERMARSTSGERLGSTATFREGLWKFC